MKDHLICVRRQDVVRARAMYPEARIRIDENNRLLLDGDPDATPNEFVCLKKIKLK